MLPLLHNAADMEKGLGNEAKDPKILQSPSRPL